MCLDSRPFKTVKDKCLDLPRHLTLSSRHLSACETHFKTLYPDRQNVSKVGSSKCHDSRHNYICLHSRHLLLNLDTCLVIFLDTSLKTWFTEVSWSGLDYRDLFLGCRSLKQSVEYVWVLHSSRYMLQDTKWITIISSVAGPVDLPQRMSWDLKHCLRLKALK